MKKITFIILCTIGIYAMSSCKKDDSTGVDPNAQFYNWQSRNDTYFKTIYDAANAANASGDKTWFKVFAYNKNIDFEEPEEYVVVHVLEQKTSHNELTSEGKRNTSGDLTCPQYTDTITVTYKGSLMPYDDGSTWAEQYNTLAIPEGILAGAVYETANLGSTFETKYYDDLETVADLEDNAYFTKFSVSGLTSGFCTAVQYMHPGDRWRIYIPYNLGYGTSGSGSSIPGGSTLIFDLYMKSFKTK